MRTGELTYMAIEAKKATFAEISLIKSDMFFAKSDRYTILYLKQHKTNMEYTRIQIFLAVTSKQMYPIATLKKLFI